MTLHPTVTPNAGLPDSGRPLRIGARKSPLAVAQAEWVADLLRARGHTVELVGITSQGDVDQRKLTEIGGTGVFAAAVRYALLDGSIDIAVHSLKDLPVAPAPGLELVAVPVREDARDVVVGLAPEQWRDDTVVGTGSPRRELQLRELAAARGVHPTFVPVRGNVDTRIDLVRGGTVAATVLAAAGLRRLGRLTDADPDHVDGVPATVLGLDQMLPAAGQGALGVEIAADSWCREAVARLDDPTSRAAVTAERTFLATLEAGCLAPIGAHADVVGAGSLPTADHASSDGAGAGEPHPNGLTLRVVTATKVVDAGHSGVLHDEVSGQAPDGAALGDQLARRVLRRLGVDGFGAAGDVEEPAPVQLPTGPGATEVVPDADDVVAAPGPDRTPDGNDQQSGGART